MEQAYFIRINPPFFAVLDVLVAFFVLKNVGEIGRPKLDGFSVYLFQP